MDLEQLKVYSLENNHIKLSVTNAGAAVTSLKVKDKNNQWQDVVLGFEDLSHYVTQNSVCFGSVVGRNANRIKDGRLELNGQNYQLEKNNGGNNLHSGSNGFHVRLWELESQTKNSLTLTLKSLDKDQDFPGTMIMKVTYTLFDDQVEITYEGVSDQDTLFNPTNHTYFNLEGHEYPTVMEHSLEIPSDYFMPMAEDSVPTGARCKVEGTPMDFRVLKKLNQDFDLSDEQLDFGNGYDHHFVLRNQEEMIKLVSEKSGISLNVSTDMPGVQIYTANFVQNIKGKNGVVYQERSGVCLETQFCPNAINNDELSPILKKGIVQRYRTIWAFNN